MGRDGMKRRKARSVGDGKHVRLHRWLLASPAWRHASLVERCLLVELYDLYNGENNGEVFMSVREAARRLGIGKNTAQRGLVALQGKGFIRVRQRGDFNWKSHQATSWILTEFTCDGQPATRDFVRWRPAIETQNPVTKMGTPCHRTRDRDAVTVPAMGTGVPP